MHVLCSCHYDVGRRRHRKWGMQLVHWVHVYVKVNLIMLIKKERSGLNKLVNRGKRVSVRVTASGGRGSDDLGCHSATKRGNSPPFNKNHIISCTKMWEQRWRQGEVCTVLTTESSVGILTFFFTDECGTLLQIRISSFFSGKPLNTGAKEVFRRYL